VTAIMPFKKLRKNKYRGPSGKTFTLAQVRRYYARGGTFDAPASSDPTKTLGIRRGMTKELEGRWRTVKLAVVRMVGGDTLPPVDRIKTFQAWFDNLLSTAVLGDTGWMSYLRAGYAQGVIHAAPRAAPPPNDHLSLIAEGTYAELQGIVEAVSQQAVRVIAAAALTSSPAREAVTLINRAIDKVGVLRTRALVSSAVVRAHATGTLDTFEASGVRRVGIIPEHHAHTPPVTRDAGFDPSQPRNEHGEWTATQTAISLKGMHPYRFSRKYDSKGFIFANGQAVEFNPYGPSQWSHKTVFEKTDISYEEVMSEGAARFITSNESGATNYNDTLHYNSWGPPTKEQLNTIWKIVEGQRLRVIYIDKVNDTFNWTQNTTTGEMTPHHSIVSDKPINRKQFVSLINEAWPELIKDWNPFQPRESAGTPEGGQFAETGAEQRKRVRREKLKAIFGDPVSTAAVVAATAAGVILYKLFADSLTLDAPRRRNLVNVITAGDNRVCQECEDIAADGPYTIAEARALIPAHPSCRCAFSEARDESVRDAGFRPSQRRDPDGQWTNEAGDPIEFTSGPEGKRSLGYHLQSTAISQYRQQIAQHEDEIEELKKSGDTKRVSELEHRIEFLHDLINELKYGTEDAGFDPGQPRNREGEWTETGDTPLSDRMSQSSHLKPYKNKRGEILHGWLFPDGRAMKFSRGPSMSEEEFLHLNHDRISEIEGIDQDALLAEGTGRLVVREGPDSESDANEYLAYEGVRTPTKAQFERMWHIIQGQDLRSVHMDRQRFHPIDYGTPEGSIDPETLDIVHNSNSIWFSERRIKRGEFHQLVRRIWPDYTHDAGFDPRQPRNEEGEWTEGGGATPLADKVAKSDRLWEYKPGDEMRGFLFPDGRAMELDSMGDDNHPDIAREMGVNLDDLMREGTGRLVLIGERRPWTGQYDPSPIKPTTLNYDSLAAPTPKQVDKLWRLVNGMRMTSVYLDAEGGGYEAGPSRTSEWIDQKQPVSRVQLIGLIDKVWPQRRK